MKKSLLVFSALFALGLASCGAVDNSSNSVVSSETSSADTTSEVNSSEESTSQTSTSADDSSSEVEEDIYPTEVSIPNSASMIVGDTKSLKVTVNPSDANMLDYSWSSDNESVASVDSDGVITANSAGTAIITISVNDEDGNALTDTCEVTVSDSSGSEIDPTEVTGDFSLVTSDGSFSQSGGIYTIESAGTYTASGSLTGQIIINAGDDDEVVLELNGVDISYDEDSPILATNASKLEISAKSGTTNTIYDTRSVKTDDASTLGEGAINAKCDLKLKGSGYLYVEGNYNNGVHTTKDLTIQKQTLQVKAYNNALKGKDGIEIVSGTITAISTNGDGIETSNTDTSSKGNQRGIITITDGTIEVYSAGDSIQAAYDFVMDGGTLTTYSYSYSSYTNKSASVDSYKGVKAENEIIINGGTLNIKSYDDGLHANYGTTFENDAATTGVGNVTINGGTLNFSTNSTLSNGSGMKSIHADNTVTVNDGTINISSAAEGIEANFINIVGGSTKIYATDDGINASNKIGYTPAVVVSGGRLDIVMSGNDTDGIDSNGSFTQSGGVIITRGAPNSSNSMATGLDVDGTAKITGGTYVQLGGTETSPTVSNAYTCNFGSSSSQGGGWWLATRPGPGGGGSSSSSSYSFSSGTWTIEAIDLSFVVDSSYTYYGAKVISSSFTSGTSYTITNGSTSYTATAS